MRTTTQSPYYDETVLAPATCIARLRRSERGQQALQDIKTFFDNGAYGLDGDNQRAVIDLIHYGLACGYHTIDSDLTRAAR